MALYAFEFLAGDAHFTDLQWHFGEGEADVWAFIALIWFDVAVFAEGCAIGGLRPDDEIRYCWVRLHARVNWL